MRRPVLPASGLVSVCALFVIAACGDGGGATDGGMEEDGLVNGCPSWAGMPLASPGDPIDGDTYATFAMPFFESYCVSCHSTANTGDTRNGAPPGRNWDDEASVRMFLAEMRRWVGEINVMPLGDGPKPTCDERRRLVRWIDADAP
jgi:hypothetical protein